jgi:ketosteroid isomerase-like protein
MTSDDDLVRLHEDERQIRNLIARLGHLADYGGLDEYMTLFTDDAGWDLGGTVVEGADAIRADRVSRRSQGTQGPGTNTRHMNTTMWVDVDGSDLATAHSYYVFVGDAGTSPTVMSTGRYHDTFRRTSAGWKLAHRRIRQQD